MNKQQEALKLALEALEIGHEYAVETAEHFHIEMAGYKQHRHDAMDAEVKQIADAITAINDALAEQPAQGCEFCSHSLYAGTKCKNCGREQPAQQDSTCNKTLREALADHVADNRKLVEQPAQQQEPVGQLQEEAFGRGQVMWFNKPVDQSMLYTSPPASKPWVGLTDEEVDECYYWKGRQWTTDELVRHVEAKLREKNNG